MGHRERSLSDADRKLFKSHVQGFDLGQVFQSGRRVRNILSAVNLGVDVLNLFFNGFVKAVGVVQRLRTFFDGSHHFSGNV